LGPVELRAYLVLTARKASEATPANRASLAYPARMVLTEREDPREMVVSLDLQAEMEFKADQA